MNENAEVSLSISREYDDWQVRAFLREQYAQFEQYERAHRRDLSLAGLGDWHFIRASKRKAAEVRP